MTISPRTLFMLSLTAGLPLSPALRAADADDAAGQAYQVLRKYCRQCHAGPADRVKGDLQVLDPRRCGGEGGARRQARRVGVVPAGRVRVDAAGRPAEAGSGRGGRPPAMDRRRRGRLPAGVRRRLRDETDREGPRRRKRPHPRRHAVPALRQLQPPARRGRRTRVGPVAGRAAPGAQPSEPGAEPGPRHADRPAREHDLPLR